jgi:catechol 2,3-dioxygenase-like lactoylglutathione lyase family enzyme
MSFGINPLVPELWCSDFERSLNFYTETLGFSVAQRHGGESHAYLSFAGAQIMIAHWAFTGEWEPWMPEPLDKPFGRGVNFQFMTDDVRGLHARVTQAGIAPFVGLHSKSYWRTDRIDERTQFAVLDPDGYLLRFAQVDSCRPIGPAETGPV